MSIIIGILILGIIVFIHELGHFFSAKLFGVKVESFSIGMGPVLLHKTIKGTDWRLSLLPFGGYCGMKGEQDFIKAYDAGLSEVKGEKDSLYGIHPLKRAVIAFAGPFFNFVFAVFAFFIIALIGYTYYTYSNTVTLASDVYSEYESAAALAGIKTGDKIIKIEDTQIEDFSDIQSYISLHAEEELNITVERNGEILEFSVTPVLDKSTGVGKIGIVSNPDSLVKKEAKRYGFFGAIKYSFTETFSMLGATIKGIATLFKGVDVTSAVSGPARITSMLGDTVKFGFSEGIRTGFSAVLNFTALISISLFLMNLLPVPILDGGLILFSFIEAIIRKSIPPKIRYRVQFIGLAFIALLFIVAMTGDIKYFFGAK